MNWGRGAAQYVEELLFSSKVYTLFVAAGLERARS